MKPNVFIALPVMDEEALLPRTLDCLRRQTYSRFRLVVCVNQPEDYRNSDDRMHICESNARTLAMLRQISGLTTHVIDHSSEGKGWRGKKHGVGMARKTAMDFAVGMARDDDILVSLDADTWFSDNYLATLVDGFAAQNASCVAVAVPYYHRLTDVTAVDRAVLRYEIYMRHYFLNLSMSGSPYAFTALGSAMAVKCGAYRAIGGMTPKLSGEDFYFLQKLAKYGRIGLRNAAEVYPEARFSDRVFFGTGPAMIRGAAGDWESYPIYPDILFGHIRSFYQLLPDLYDHTPDHPVIGFLREIFREDDPFGPLRQNHPDRQRFFRACHEKFDGLRILQFLKTHNPVSDGADERNLIGFLDTYYPGRTEEAGIKNPGSFSFRDAGIEEMSALRDFLYRREAEVRLSSGLS